MNTIKPDSIFIRKEDIDNYHNADIVRIRSHINQSPNAVFFNRFIRKTSISTISQNWDYHENIKNFLKKYKKIKISKVCKVTSFPYDNYLIIQSNDKFIYLNKQSPEIEIEIIGCDKKRNIVYYKEIKNKKDKILTINGDYFIRLIYRKKIKSIDEWEEVQHYAVKNDMFYIKRKTE